MVTRAQAEKIIGIVTNYLVLVGSEDNVIDVFENTILQVQAALDEVV